jgi:hypothetical protein
MTLATDTSGPNESGEDTAALRPVFRSRVQYDMMLPNAQFLRHL